MRSAVSSLQKPPEPLGNIRAGRYKRGALFDQRDLVAAEQAQLGHQGIFFGQRFPAVAIDAQGIGEAPSVHMIGFVAAGNFALAIGFGARWRNRVNRDSAFQ